MVEVKKRERKLSYFFSKWRNNLGEGRAQTSLVGRGVMSESQSDQRET